MRAELGPGGPARGVERRHRPRGGEEPVAGRDDPERGTEDAADLVGVGMHVDEHLAGARAVERRVALRRHLAEPRAHDQHDVGLLEARDQRRRAGRADVASVGARARRQQVLAAERDRRGDAVRLGEGDRLAAALVGPARAADEHQRLLGAGEDLAHARDVRRGRGGAMRDMGLGVARVRGVDEHVLGQRQHDGPRTAGGRDVEGARHVLGDALDAVDLRGPLGDRPEHLAVVDLLEALAVHRVARDLADEQDHRRGVLEGGVHADRGMAGAGTARHHRDARPAGELAVGLRHVRGARLVARIDQPDRRRIVQRVEHLEVALARHAERHVGAVDEELVDEDPAAAAAVARGHLAGPPCSRGAQ